jgi:hypothetical protein
VCNLTDQLAFSDPHSSQDSPILGRYVWVGPLLWEKPNTYVETKRRRSGGDFGWPFGEGLRGLTASTQPSERVRRARSIGRQKSSSRADSRSTYCAKAPCATDQYVAVGISKQDLFRFLGIPRYSPLANYDLKVRLELA